MPTLSLPLSAVVAGLGTLAAALSLPAQGRSLVAAGVVVGLTVAGVGAVALALRALADSATALVWAPITTLVLLPILVVTTRRFLAPEATA